MGALIWVAVGALLAALPSLINNFLNGGKSATNYAGGIASVAGISTDMIVAVLTIAGLLAIISGFMNMRFKQVFGGFILILFAPQIAGLIVPLVPEPQPYPVTTTTTPMPSPSPSPIPSPIIGSSCTDDPLNNIESCPNEIRDALRSRLREVGTYESSGLGAQFTVFALIYTSCGYYWSGVPPQSVAFIDTNAKDCEIYGMYIYVTNYKSTILQGLANPISTIATKYYVDIEMWPFPNALIYESSVMKTSLYARDWETRPIMVRYISHAEMREIAKRLESGKTYNLVIKVWDETPLTPTTRTLYYKVTLKKQPWDEYLYPDVESLLSVVPPEYDPKTGLNLQLVSQVLGIIGSLLLIYRGMRYAK